MKIFINPFQCNGRPLQGITLTHSHSVTLCRVMFFFRLETQVAQNILDVAD